jgi:hypothetical protein
MTSVRSKARQTELKKLVIERLKASSSDLRVSIGSSHYTKKDLLTSVINDEPLGKKVIKTQLAFLKDMASGKIYR